MDGTDVISIYALVCVCACCMLLCVCVRACVRACVRVRARTSVYERYRMAFILSN